MFITVQLRADIARSMQLDPSAGTAAEDLRATLQSVGARLAPMHPGIDDEEMARQFSIEVEDEEQGERILQRLRAIDGVEAAYMKRGDSPPF